MIVYVKITDQELKSILAMLGDRDPSLLWAYVSQTACKTP